MSVDVKTPTRTQFEHCEFPCHSSTTAVEQFTCSVDKKASGSSLSSGSDTLSLKILDKSANLNRKANVQDEGDRGRRASITRKRRNSDKSPVLTSCPLPFKRRPSHSGRRSIEKEKIVLPTKFLLGGSITDPLNLNSMCDEEINRALNENTPQSSPLPFPTHKQEVKVLIPPNINDPLNLNSGDDVKLDMLSGRNLSGKKKKHKNRKRKSLESATNEPIETNYAVDASVSCSQPITIEIAQESEDVSMPSRDNIDMKIGRIIDKIVSPVIPQKSPKAKKRKRNSSECKLEPLPSATVTKPASLEEQKVVSDMGPPAPHHHQRHRRQSGSRSNKKSKTKDHKFIYGNYNRYYGYRNPETEDPRLGCIKKDWIDGKDVLDVGCNVGHLTLSIAKFMQPKRIVGIDIDRNLIVAAKKNIRHYLSGSVPNIEKFPTSLRQTYGPICAPVTATEKTQNTFPNNIMFMQGNYVPEHDEQVQLQQEEYDVIFCFSITKWLHLNFGDAGLKRAFQRMYRQLRPGGRLILEPQAWASYKRKKNLTDAIQSTYQSIKFKPEHFTEFLLSSAVGFSMCQQLEAPFNKSKGFQRPMLLYTKPETANPTPFGQDSRNVTPYLSSSVGTTPLQLGTPFNTYSVETPQSQNSTPRFEIGSSGHTPASTRGNSPYCQCSLSSCVSPHSDHSKITTADLTEEPIARVTETCSNCLGSLNSVQDRDVRSDTDDNPTKAGGTDNLVTVDDCRQSDKLQLEKAVDVVDYRDNTVKDEEERNTHQ